MMTDNEKKIPSNYFLYPEFLAFVLLPVTWGLLPIAGFYPELLGGFLPVMFLWTKPIEIVIRFQVSTSICFFKTFEILHMHFMPLRFHEILLFLLTTLNYLVSSILFFWRGEGGEGKHLLQSLKDTLITFLSNKLTTLCSVNDVTEGITQEAHMCASCVLPRKVDKTV
jgi:hypothetical protein